MNTVIINCQSGEITERATTSEEIARIAAHKAETDAQLLENAAREAAAAVVRESARTKLAALGLTEAEVAALVK